MAISILSYYTCLTLYVICRNVVGSGANSSSQIWCPESHRALEMKGFLFHVCLPMSCAKPTSVPMTLHTGEASISHQCQAFSEKFKKCEKVFLTSDRFHHGSDGNISSKHFKSYIQQGDYFLQSTGVTVCGHDVAPLPEARTTALRAATTPKPCMPFRVSQDGYQWKSNGSIFINSVSDFLPQGYYQLDGNASVVRACYQTEIPILDCRPLTRIARDKMIVMPSMALNTSFVTSITYPLGNYLLAEDMEFAIVCVGNSTPVYHGELTVTLYGVASLISAIFLFLALLAHIFFTHLNYHTKALLCLAFSLLIMYIAVCIRSFGYDIDFTWVGNAIIFAIQYIFGLSSFLWLNVVAYDLWRVFSNQKPPSSPIANKKKGKRWFIIKCTYAFGIPVLICAAAIGISFSKTVQQTLQIYMVFDNNNWFQGDVGILALFYGPIMVILASNAIFFALTVKHIRKARSGSAILRSNNKDLKIFKVYIKLFIIMGLSWFAEIISWFAIDKADETVWYFSDLVNILQGFFIFLVYVCKKKTLERIKEKFEHISTKTIQISHATKSTRLSNNSQRERRSQRISTVSLTPMSLDVIVQR